MKHILNLLIIFTVYFNSSAQAVKLLNSSSKASLRGLSVVSDKTVWVSGSAGTVGRSIDGGETWKWMTVKGFENADFRDIEAFDKTTAVIIAIDSPAYILRTTDSGENWEVVFKSNDKGMFLDAMEFWNEQSGVVIGDPIDHKFFMARTFDGGKTWTNLPESRRPVADSGEACFASSGTNIRKLNNSEAIFITGGLKSRVFMRDKKITMPIIQGTESTGANSIAVKNSKTFMVVGGDFKTKDSTQRNCVYTVDGGTTWKVPSTPPHGYRSGIEYIQKKQWVTCGLTGVDISDDDGDTFKTISSTGFHAVRKAKTGTAVYFSGGGGRIGKLVQ